jgi:hypothetical protein
MNATFALYKTACSLQHDMRLILFHLGRMILQSCSTIHCWTIPFQYDTGVSAAALTAVTGADAFFLEASAAELVVLLRFALVLVPPTVKFAFPGFKGRKVGRPSPGTEMPQCLARTS